MKRTESGTSFQEWHERNASIVVEENQQLNMEVDMFFDSKEDPIITDNAFYNDDDVNNVVAKKGHEGAAFQSQHPPSWAARKSKTPNRQSSKSILRLTLARHYQT